MSESSKAQKAEAWRNNTRSEQRDAISREVNGDAPVPDFGDSSSDDADDPGNSGEEEGEGYEKWTDRFAPGNLPGE